MKGRKDIASFTLSALSFWLLRGCGVVDGSILKPLTLGESVRWKAAASEGLNPARLSCFSVFCLLTPRIFAFHPVAAHDMQFAASAFETLFVALNKWVL